MTTDSPDVLARIKDGLALVDIVARQLRRQMGAYVDVEELTSQGREALVTAARAYDPDRGVPFRKWANIRIRGAMLDAIRQRGSLPRRVYQKLRAMQAADRVQEVAAEEESAAPATTAESADARLGSTLSASAMAMAVGFLAMRGGDAVDGARDAGDSPEEAMARAEMAKLVRQAIAAQPDAERHLLERHYFHDVTFEEAAKELGLSKSWASRLHARALENIAKTLERDRP